VRPYREVLLAGYKYPIRPPDRSLRGVVHLVVHGVNNWLDQLRNDATRSIGGDLWRRVCCRPWTWWCNDATALAGFATMMMMNPVRSRVTNCRQEGSRKLKVSKVDHSHSWDTWGRRSPLTTRNHSPVLPPKKKQRVRGTGVPKRVGPGAAISVQIKSESLTTLQKLIKFVK